MPARTNRDGFKKMKTTSVHLVLGFWSYQPHRDVQLVHLHASRLRPCPGGNVLYDVERIRYGLKWNPIVNQEIKRAVLS